MLLDGDHDEEYSVQLLKVHFCIVDVAYRSWLAYVKLVWQYMNKLISNKWLAFNDSLTTWSLSCVLFEYIYIGLQVLIFGPIEPMFNMLVQMCAGFGYQSIKPKLLPMNSFIERFLVVLLRTKNVHNSV